MTTLAIWANGAGKGIMVKIHQSKEKMMHMTRTVTNKPIIRGTSDSEMQKETPPGKEAFRRCGAPSKLSRQKMDEVWDQNPALTVSLIRAKISTV